MASQKLTRLTQMLRQVGATPDDMSQLESANSTSQSAGKSALDVVNNSSSSVEEEIATETLDLLVHGEPDEIDDEQQGVLEAIVMPYYRPVVDITNGKMTTTQLSKKWYHLGEEKLRQIIEATFASVGRVEIPGHPSLPYAGTGFVVGKGEDGRGLLMTNRHVAELFATGIGLNNLQFRSGYEVTVDFLREHGRDDASDTLTVEKVLMIHPYWDMALLQVTGLDEERRALSLSATAPGNLEGREVITVGYPGYDPTGDHDYQSIQNRIFRGIYYVKRLQPGMLRTRQGIDSYNQEVQAVTHDCSTLGGNSGSAVLLLPDSHEESIEVVGLHFAGLYLQANYAVPTYDLAKDQRVLDTGIEFSGNLPSSDEQSVACWNGLETETL